MDDSGAFEHIIWGGLEWFYSAAEDFFNIGLGVVLMPLVIPWGYVWRFM